MHPGVLHTHRSLGAMTHALRTAWDWRREDRILHALPLHHVHGLVNALLCAHAAGASVHFLPSFSPAAVWGALQVPHSKKHISSPLGLCILQALLCFGLSRDSGML